MILNYPLGTIHTKFHVNPGNLGGGQMILAYNKNQLAVLKLALNQYCMPSVLELILTHHSSRVWHDPCRNNQPMPDSGQCWVKPFWLPEKSKVSWQLLANLRWRDRPTNWPIDRPTLPPLSPVWQNQGNTKWKNTTDGKIPQQTKRSSRTRKLLLCWNSKSLKKLPLTDLSNPN